jgi:predicted RecA/RadA family phage recombinase
MNNHVQPGDTITVTAPYAVDSGDGVLVGSLFGIACDDALISATDLEILTVGVFDIKKTDAITFTMGAAVFWDDTAKSVTNVAAGNRRIGAATIAAAGGDANARVRLDGHAGPVSVDDNASA